MFNDSWNRVQQVIQKLRIYLDGRSSLYAIYWAILAKKNVRSVIPWLYFVKCRRAGYYILIETHLLDCIFIFQSQTRIYLME